MVQAVRAGDDHAFERLYHRYHRRIATYIVGMVRDYGRAEDLTQEVFVSALRRMRQTERAIAFKPWIYEIAKNASIDAFRRARRADEVSYDAAEGMTPSDYGKLVAIGAGPDVAVDTKQRLDDLCGAFGGLSDAHHQILVMRELEGLSYREIGERLGMTRSSVESTLFRARRRLTEEYGELVSGERCLRIQQIIGATAGDGALGLRDRRRVGAHISYCHPCHRQAQLAGLDTAALARRPLRTRLAGLLPLPAFLRRRMLPDGHHDSAVSAATGAHAPSLTQLSASAVHYGEPAMAGWMKAAALATAVAVTGVGAGTAVHDAGSTKRHHAPAEQPSADPGSGSSSGSGSGSSSGAAVGARPLASSTRTTQTSSRASSGGSAPRSRSSLPAPTTNSATSPVDRDAADGGTDRDAADGGTDRATSTPASDTPAARNADADADKPVTQATTPVTAALDPVTSTATDAGAGSPTSSSEPAPIVDPDPGQLLQPPASTPDSVGGAVTQVTDTVGDTVGGSAGQTVSDLGGTVGDTVDDVTDVVGGILGGLGSR